MEPKRYLHEEDQGPYLFTVVAILVLILGLAAIVSHTWSEMGYTPFTPQIDTTGQLKEPPAPLFGLSAPIRSIPDGRGNYRSGSLTADQLKRALASGNIRFVLRMNGDGSKDQGPLSTNEERAIVEAAGATYVTSTLTLNRFDAHAGYREGSGYVGALNNAITYLRQGGVLIHCRHGHDRTGAIVGGWLAANGLDYDLIIAHNNWHGYAKKGGGYLRYLETVEGQLVNLTK